MADFDMKGYLGKNKNRSNDKQPTHRGKCTINGTAYWISGWRREKDGDQFLSLAFQPVEETQTSRRPEPDTSTDDDDDVPF